MNLEFSLVKYLIIGTFALSQMGIAERFTRIVYEDDPILRRGIGFVERAYGATIFVLQGPHPENPIMLPGIVLHTADEDAHWAIGENNPAERIRALSNKISDKWIEYNWIIKYAPPEMHPPVTRLGSDFVNTGTPPSELENIRRQINEWLQTTLDATDENEPPWAFLKLRHGFHSEGILPKTEESPDNNWLNLYEKYLRVTKPQIEEIRRRIGTSESLESLTHNLPYIEGAVLEQLLQNPSSVIIQKRMKIEKEIRVHVLDGKVLRDRSQLRFYELGHFLSTGQRQEIENTIQRFVDNLVQQGFSDARYFTSATDIAIEKTTGRPVLLDLNPGYTSGYLFPEEDLFVTNAVAEFFSQEPTYFLSKVRQFQNAAFSQKADLLQELYSEFQSILTNRYSFWEHIHQIYIDEILTEPTPEKFDDTLAQLRRAGLNDSYLFHNFIQHAQTLLPQLQLPTLRANYWSQYLNDLSAEVVTYVNGGRFLAQDREALLQPQAQTCVAQLVREAG